KITCLERRTRFVNGGRAIQLKTQVAHGLKWQMTNIFGRQVLSLVVIAILTRLLDKSAFGILALVSVYISFVSLLAEQGIGTAVVQKKDLSAAHLNGAFWFNLACASVLCVATLLLAGPVAAALREPLVGPLLRWSS